MAVRNFYLAARADDRASRVGVGPARKDGGMDATFTIREDGGIREAFSILAGERPDGRLQVRVWVPGAESPAVDIITDR